MKRLQVNIAHCATLRQARGGSFPDPVWAASMAELAGARGIIAHLREDRAHLQDRDVRLLRQTVRGTFVMATAPGEALVTLACEIKPHTVILMPPQGAKGRLRGGADPSVLDVTTPGLADMIERLRSVGSRVALHVAPDVTVVRRAGELGAQAVELDSAEYGVAQGTAKDVHLQRLASAAVAAAGAGLAVGVGGALDYENVGPVAAVPGIEDFNIGHAIMGHALFVGMERAVAAMDKLIQG